ncbi:MAG TPA: PQQ-binding-like beta-propeller repeat protein [Actinomycetota bacterium]|nr:PQQ-binding-like beta-propeller repeat protein [Actinomycetota bacterium]
MALISVATLVAVATLVIDAASTPPEPLLTPQQDPVVVAAPINTFPGLTMFRGNASRSYYGEGPVPAAPAVRWAIPDPKACRLSSEGLEGSEVKEWCGTGWTGQPNVVPWEDAMQVRVGMFDGAYHFVDAGDGRDQLLPLQTGDLAKGSATTDPDNYPLYYAGSRDNLFRIIATDRDPPEVLWTLDARTSVPEWKWNDDWDGSALVVDGYLIEAGENGWIYVIRLNRGRDERGLVTVSPEVVATIQGWDDELLRGIGDEDVSFEGSVAFRDGVVYAANSGGLVQGWDISDVLAGGDVVTQVFRFWTGDDTDATIVIDELGYLYVATEYQRFNRTSQHLGQLMKLDPLSAADPVVWRIAATEIAFQGAGGSWSTPALYGNYVFFTTAAGRVLGVDRVTGRAAWELQIGSPAIGSPVVVDGTLIQGDCSGRLYAWDVTDPHVLPPLRWSVDLGDCIESTPAVWRGWLYVGTREGYLYGLSDEGTPPPA